MLHHSRHSHDGKLSDDSGLGIVEVLAAMLVFAIVAVGIAYSLVNTATLTRNTKLAQVATNLAAQEIDTARAALDPYALVSASSTKPVDGVTYSITRDVDWVTPAGAAVTCSTGGELSYKRVNVTVSWAGVGGTQKVTSDTLVAPSHSDKPNTGTIYIEVKNAAGTALAGVVPTIKNGSVTVKTGSATDAAGCSVVTDLTAGLVYTVEIFRSGYVGTEMDERPTSTVTVTKSSAVPVSFTYDQKSTLAMKYATNAPVTPTVIFPSSPAIQTNLTSDARTDVWAYSVPTNGTGTITVYPTRSYQAWGGPYTALTSGQNKFSNGCVATDPQAWDANGALPAGTRGAGVLATPGGSATVNVPMGIVDVTGASVAIARTLVVKSVANGDSATGRPTCTTTLTYTFPGTIPNSSSTKMRIALPWGSWKVYGQYSFFGTQEEVIPGSRLTIVSGKGNNTTGAVPTTGSATVKDVVVLDPRKF
ncbi:hypothetical protein ACDF64_01435 [Agromyces sp. MMS24-JH15]|uniref:type IV pilus modification PilV family protein n=1 Tax=Agromyces sp. MMS24-JH15 TaxID=3243765 RepID=UPI0037482CDD